LSRLSAAAPGRKWRRAVLSGKKRICQPKDPKSHKKKGLTGFTYAQNLCCGAPAVRSGEIGHLSAIKFYKLLILLNFKGCLISGQFKQGLDFQGFRAALKNLSTKLSTESLDSAGSHGKSKTYIAFRHFD
jgi:hypothetical protein